MWTLYEIGHNLQFPHDITTLNGAAARSNFLEVRADTLRLVFIASLSSSNGIPANMQIPATIGQPAKRHWNGVSMAGR